MARLTVVALCAAGALAAASQASATVMVATYEGSTNRFEGGAVFGGVFDNETVGHGPLAWVASFTYDTDLDYLHFADFEQARGIAATFTLNGVTIDIGGSGLAQRNGNFSFENSQSDGASMLSAAFVLPPGVPVPALNQTVDPTSYPGICSGFFVTAGAGGNLCTNRVTVAGGVPSDTMVVPEPATWTMLVLGIGGVGAMLRRRARILTA